MSIYYLQAAIDTPAGEQTFNAEYNLAGVEDAVLSELEALDGGTVEAVSTVTTSADGVDIALGVNLPAIGEKSLSLDTPLSGLADDVVKDLIALDGGKVTATLAVSKTPFSTPAPAPTDPAPAPAPVTPPATPAADEPEPETE